MIICAAITRKNLIYVGKNHAEIIQNYFLANDQRICGVQGFINHRGEFLDRKAARIEALGCNQIIDEETFHKEDLFSEDLTLVAVIWTTMQVFRGTKEECSKWIIENGMIAQPKVLWRIMSQKTAENYNL